MFQTLVIIASMIVLSGAILTSTLVTAKAALHQTIVAKSQTAMTDATAQFLGWAQNFAYQYGPEADWAAPSVQQAPAFRLMCPATATTPCPFGATVQWRVTGATKGVPQQGVASGQAVSQAQNMAPAIDEQRISATISVTVTDATGRTIYGGRTREVTARAFDASPYVVITGTRDLSSAVGSQRQSEGDSGGVSSHVGQGQPAATAPISTQPYEFIDTVIRTTIDCANSPGFNQANPMSTSDAAKNIDYQYRSYGSQVWAYEMPCTPGYGIPPPPPDTKNYSPPVGTTYQIGASEQNAVWETGNHDDSSFPR